MLKADQRLAEVNGKSPIDASVLCISSNSQRRGLPYCGQLNRRQRVLPGGATFVGMNFLSLRYQNLCFKRISTEAIGNCI